MRTLMTSVEPQTHWPGCWHWANHWRCAVRLVRELRNACEMALRFLDSLPEDYQTAESARALRSVLEQALARSSEEQGE